MSDRDVLRDIAAYFRCGMESPAISMGESMLLEDWVEALDSAVGLAREGDVLLTREQAERAHEIVNSLAPDSFDARARVLWNEWVSLLAAGRQEAERG